MVIFKFLYGFLQLILFSILFVVASIIAGVVGFFIWFVKREERYVYYWEKVLFAIIHPFFPTFGG